MRSIFLCLLFFAITANLTAQPLNRATYATMIRVAEEKLAEKDYYNAIDWYEKSYEERRDYDVAMIIANLHYLVRDYARAERWFSRVLKRQQKDDRYEGERFTYGKVLKMIGKYDDAIKEFNKYIETATDPVKKELAMVEIKGAEFAKIAPEVKNLTITNAGRTINSSYSEYSAYLAPGGNQMYFSSFMAEEIIVVDPKKDGEYYAKLFTAERTPEGWGKPTPMDQQINRPGYHNSNVTLSPDGRRMYFTRQQLGGNVVTESKIYMSERSGNGWGPANEVTGVNGDYVARHPAVGELYGKEVLFFSSNMSGGTGGYDLYYASYLGDGKYDQPKSLGPKINTIGDDITPFYRDGILYFSSDGHPTLGGFDIFSSEWDGVTWSEPKNMGKGFNTMVDDLYFMLNNEGASGFLLSNRPGTRSLKSKTCCDDIYNVSLKIILADLIAKSFDSETKEGLNGVKLRLIDVTESEEGVETAQTNAAGNQFNFPLELDKFYVIIAERADYYPDTLEFNTVGMLDSKTFEMNANLDPIPVYITISKEEPIELQNIYYDYDDDKILTDAEQDLQLVLELMNQYPDMVIELSSHTDARGSDSYNKDLSQRRAESAVKWLEGRGIPRNRMKAVGYGETVPKTVNDKLAAQFAFLQKGQVLTETYINTLAEDAQKEAAHRINRRTEFKIISGPTSIKIEEKRLVRKGAKEVAPQEGGAIEEKKN